jgi:hypothetical protein
LSSANCALAEFSGQGHDDRSFAANGCTVFFSFFWALRLLNPRRREHEDLFIVPIRLEMRKPQDA